MKYCVYCGVVLADNAALFCAECGKPVSKAISQTEVAETEISQVPRKSLSFSPKLKKQRKKYRNQNLRLEPKNLNDGYDGYYDDVPTDDDGQIKEEFKPGLIKRILLVGAVALIIIILAFLAIYYL